MELQPIRRPVRPWNMRTGRVLVAMSFVLVTVAACKGQATSAAAPASSAPPTITTVPSAPPSADQGAPTLISPPPVSAIAPPPVVPPPTQPAPPAGGVAVPPKQVQTGSALPPPEGVRVTHGGLDVVFTSEQAGCQQISAKATSQTAKAVTIVITKTITSKGSQVCPLYIREVPVVVVLDAPLGSRTLVFQGVTKHN
jgi:hypothetical protein